VIAVVLCKDDLIKSDLIGTSIILAVTVILLVLAAALARWMARGVLSGRKGPAIIVVLFMLTFSLGEGAMLGTGAHRLAERSAILPQVVAGLIFALLVCRSFFDKV